MPWVAPIVISAVEQTNPLGTNAVFLHLFAFLLFLECCPDTAISISRHTSPGGNKLNFYQIKNAPARSERRLEATIKGFILQTGIKGGGRAGVDKDNCHCATYITKAVRDMKWILTINFIINYVSGNGKQG